MCTKNKLGSETPIIIGDNGTIFAKNFGLKSPDTHMRTWDIYRSQYRIGCKSFIITNDSPMSPNAADDETHNSPLGYLYGAVTYGGIGQMVQL